MKLNSKNWKWCKCLSILAQGKYIAIIRNTVPLLPTGQVPGQTAGQKLRITTQIKVSDDIYVDRLRDPVSYISELLNLKSMKRRIEDFVASRGDLKPASTWVLYQAFIQGSISRSDALTLTGERDERTARRLLKKLRDQGLLVDADPKDSRSPLLWSVPEHAEPVYFPKLSPQ